MLKWAGYMTRMGVKRNACRTLVGNPNGKRPLGKHRNRCVKVKIKVNFTLEQTTKAQGDNRGIALLFL